MLQIRVLITGEQNGGKAWKGKSRLKSQLDVFWVRKMESERKREREAEWERERNWKKRSWPGIHVSGNWIKLSELTIFVTHTLYQIFKRERERKSGEKEIVSLLMIHCRWMTREIWKY